MTTAYFDTSALLKLILDEDGSEHATRIWREMDRVASSRLCYPEARAALAAGRRAGRLARGYDRARSAFEQIYRRLYVMEVDDALVHTAGDLAERFALRGYDAVHLASAVQLDPSTTVLVSWDLELAHAGAAAGLAVSPPIG